MKRIAILLPLFFFFFRSSGQENFPDTVALYFSELKESTKQYESLWNKDIYAPLLLVNRNTREVYANYPDSAGVLLSKGSIFYGLLPKNINISNTAVKWNGRNWAMVMLPLSKNKENRINLLTHELFHRSQNDLGFYPFNPENNHLDQKDGRVYLRLELEALKKAVLSDNPFEKKKHIKHALWFREIRHSIYPGSDSTENLLEVNEGICEFTGLMMSGRDAEEIKEHFMRRIDEFITSPSYIRSFAYETIPVYGYLLYSKNKNWNKEINKSTDLGKYMVKAFGIKSFNHGRKVEGSIANLYNYDQIAREETTRENKFKEKVAKYKAIFVDSAHVEIPLIKMNMSFDYTKPFSLGNYGMVYPSIRITDEWGIMEAANGAMINSSWSRVLLGYPRSIGSNRISGDGWTLELKDGFVFEKEEATGNCVVKRKE